MRTFDNNRVFYIDPRIKFVEVKLLYIKLGRIRLKGKENGEMPAFLSIRTSERNVPFNQNIVYSGSGYFS